MNKILKQFIIGSSFPILFLFMIVRNIPDDMKNYSYEAYTIISPIYFGLMNILALKVGYNIIGLISSLLVFTFSYQTKQYNFQTNEEWFSYFLRVLGLHVITMKSLEYLGSAI